MSHHLLQCLGLPTLCFIFICASLYLFIVATIGFIDAPYYVNETAGIATLTIGVINGTIDVSVSLNVQLQDGSAVGMSKLSNIVMFVV